MCQVCDFSPPLLDRALRESFFEAHHVVPLADAVGDVSTRIGDMILLCAGCHRFVHKLIASHKRWVSISEARSMFSV
ncbi:HNH endonuclease [Rhizobium ruizarguesonis]|uniref:HNH endonuclease n=1 Tax=Rhizobium ruizarguesonis TaxID=2081791 RepID=UPI0037CA8584